MDSWDQYEAAGVYDHPKWGRSSPNHSFRYNTKDIVEIQEEFEAWARLQNPRDPQVKIIIQKWWDAKKKDKDELMARRREIEDWMETRAEEKRKSNALIREQRAAFFLDCASQLSRPIPEKVLSTLPSFQSAIKINRAATTRAWAKLEPKLLEEREIGERLEREKTHRYNDLFGPRDSEDLKEAYLLMQSKRKDNSTREQVVILQLADKVARELDTKVVDDRDYVILFLRSVYDKYAALTEAQQPVDSVFFTRHQLILDDAKMVYEEKILPRINGWNDVERSEKALHFRCAGCPRKDNTATYKFEKLFKHITSRHVGSSIHFQEFEKAGHHPPSSVGWLNIAWPVNLPMVPTHQHPKKSYISSDASPYVRADVIKAETAKAFDQYEAKTVGSPAHVSVREDLVHAAKRLQSTPLSSEQQSQVAFRYAIDRYRAAHNKQDPAVNYLANLDQYLISEGVPGLLGNLKCETCFQIPLPQDRNRFGTKGHSLQELLRHYRGHHTHDNWVGKFFHFPSEADLLNTLLEPQNKATLQIFEELFVRKDLVDIDPDLRRRSHATNAPATASGSSS